MSVNIKEKVIVVVGATAAGKTAYSLELAHKYNGEIINGDALQVFCGLDIGTAKIKPHEMEGITHHLLNIRKPHESYSVVEFKNDAAKLISEIAKRKKMPIIVGGSGMYIQALLFDYQFSQLPKDEHLRNQLAALTPNDLYEMLCQKDAESAKKIHPNNVKRIIRALEVSILTGQKFSELQSSTNQITRYDATVIIKTLDRKLLYERINARVDKMIKLGLEEEVKHLWRLGLEHTQALQAIGYREFMPYFREEITLEEVIDEIKKNTRHFAKRQLTWFRNKLSSVTSVKRL